MSQPLNGLALFMNNLVVLTGAGISAESGLKTFRDSDGLWEKHSIYDVATPEAWEKDQELVQKFYNDRRRDIKNAKPNQAHILLAELQNKFHVSIITQNIDDLHERAGSEKVLHLHGIITRSQSSIDPELTYPMETDVISKGELCEKGSQLRPHVVWFGEQVPKIEEAILQASLADIFVIIGTSLAVYPASSLLRFVPSILPKFLIDPGIVDVGNAANLKHLKYKATEGMEFLLMELKKYE